MKAKSITLTPTEDGLWEISEIDTTDTEGHSFRGAGPASAPQDAQGHSAGCRFRIESAGSDENGSARFRVTADDQDVTGHTFRGA